MSLPLEIAIFSHETLCGRTKEQITYYTKDFKTFREGRRKIRIRDMIDRFGPQHWKLTGLSFRNAKDTFHEELQKCALMMKLPMSNDAKRVIYEMYALLEPKDRLLESKW